MKKEYLWIGIFALALALFCFFSTKVIFHDAPEYITLAKYFSGVNNLDLFTTHSLLYPAVISPFLKIWPSLIMLKLANCLWLFLTAIVFLFLLKDKKAFILFVFSPICWFVSIQTTPVLIASFLFFLGYLFFKNQNIKYNYVYSGIFIGLSCAFYDMLFLVVAIFMLVFFFNKKLYSTMMYSVFLGIGFLPRLIFDYSLFHNPFYSLMRFFGTNTIISLGLSTKTQMFNLSLVGIPMILLTISPFLFRIYKINFKEYKSDLIFLAISAVILMIRAPLLKYLLVLAPIAILLLSRVLTDREIKWHCILSIFIILFLTWGYFGQNQDSMIQSDINKIIVDYPVQTIFAGPFQGNNLAVFAWNETPRIGWLEDLQASLNNQTILKDYSFAFRSKIPLRENIVFAADFNRNSNKTYSNYVIAASEADNITGFKKDRCYQVLCVYKP